VGEEIQVVPLGLMDIIGKTGCQECLLKGIGPGSGDGLAVEGGALIQTGTIRFPEQGGMYQTADDLLRGMYQRQGKAEYRQTVRQIGRSVYGVQDPERALAVPDFEAVVVGFFSQYEVIRVALPKQGNDGLFHLKIQVRNQINGAFVPDLTV